MLSDAIMNEVKNIAKIKWDQMKYISDFLFKNPEIGKEEFVSSQFLCNVARNMGFHVVEGYCGLDTAFLAEFRNGEGPVIALIAEYDALPEFGPEKRPAHACGHNWISAQAFGTAMILMEMQKYYKGTIRILGTPANENVGCKYEMIKMHAFDDVDIVIQNHLEKVTCLHATLLALDALSFHFKGRGSHSSVALEDSINALDAVQFMFAGINAMRATFHSDTKIHGIINEGGVNPSLISENASCRFYIRAMDRKYLDKIRPKILRCAEGAALMAGVQMQWEFFENPHEGMIHNSILQELGKEYLALENIYEFEDYEQEIAFASSDIGNVSHICPTLYMEIGMNGVSDFEIHSRQALKYVNSDYSNQLLMRVSGITTCIALDLLTNPEKILKIKEEHHYNIRRYMER